MIIFVNLDLDTISLAQFVLVFMVEVSAWKLISFPSCPCTK